MKLKKTQNTVDNSYTKCRKEVVTLKAEYNKLSADRAATDIRFNQSFYEEDEKTRKLLVRQIKQLETRKAITVCQS